MSDFRLLAEPERGRLDVIKSWLPRVGLGLLFIYIGQTKFDSNPHGTWVPVFEKIGLGQWFRYFTGVTQIAGGVLIMIPRTLKIGAALLAGTMAGAVLVDILVMHAPFFFIPLLLLMGIVVTAMTGNS